MVHVGCFILLESKGQQCLKIKNKISLWFKVTSVHMTQLMGVTSVGRTPVWRISKHQVHSLWAGDYGQEGERSSKADVLLLTVQKGEMSSECLTEDFEHKRTLSPLTLPAWLSFHHHDNFLKKFFWCGPFIKFFFWICYNIASVFYVLFFDHEVWGILAPRPGIEPTSLASEEKVLVTGPPGKSQQRCFYQYLPFYHALVIICIYV